MIVQIVLIAVFVLLWAAGIAVWIRLAAANKRTIGAPPGELRELFRGGVMARHIITSGSLARLEFFDWGVRLRGTVISSWIVPTWEARYEELGRAGLVALPASRIAVWLRLRDEQDAIAFLSERSRSILPVLERHGVLVSDAVTKIRRVEELYR
jgi:hypothetical protein